MKNLLLIIATVLFTLMAVLGIIDAAWLTVSHVAILLGFGLAAFAAAHLPIP